MGVSCCKSASAPCQPESNIFSKLVSREDHDVGQNLWESLRIKSLPLPLKSGQFLLDIKETCLEYAREVNALVSAAASVFGQDHVLPSKSFHSTPELRQTDRHFLIILSWAKGLLVVHDKQHNRADVQQQRQQP